MYNNIHCQLLQNWRPIFLLIFIIFLFHSLIHSFTHSILCSFWMGCHFRVRISLWSEINLIELGIRIKVKQHALVPRHFFLIYSKLFSLSIFVSRSSLITLFLLVPVPGYQMPKHIHSNIILFIILISKMQN